MTVHEFEARLLEAPLLPAEKTEAVRGAHLTRAKCVLEELPGAVEVSGDAPPLEVTLAQQARRLGASVLARPFFLRACAAMVRARTWFHWRAYACAHLHWTLSTHIGARTPPTVRAVRPAPERGRRG